MEMQYAKAHERKLLIAELVLIIAIGIAALIVYWLNVLQLNQALSPRLVEILYRQGHIATLVASFVLFNTTYFSYVSYKSTRMFVLSLSATFLSTLNVYFFLSSYMRIGIEGDFSAGQMHFETTAIAFLFLIGVALSHHFDEDAMISAKRKWQGSLPILLGIFIAVIWGLILTLVPRVLAPEPLMQVSVILTDLSIVVGLIVFVLEMYRFARAHRRYLVRMSSSMALLVLAFLARLIPNPNLPLASLIFNLYLLIALISYTYAAFKYNITMPILQQRNAERQITLYAENLEKIVQKRTAELKRTNELFLTDIEYAKKIQQSLLPGEYLKFSGAEFAAAYYPCERLSGDFYDIFMIDPDTLGMYVLDVSGHGIPAALMTMFCMNYIKTSERLINQYRAKKPHRNLKHFFDEFNKVNFPDEMHMVMFFAAYDMRQRQLTYCSGGMNTLPFVIRTDGAIIRLDASIGFPICRVGNFFSPDFHSAKIDLEPGDRVFFYTDGLTDKGKNQVFDEIELIDFIKALSAQDIKTMRQSLVGELKDMVNRLDDDITFFIMEVI